MKNRYSYILPYDHSRVKLTLIDGKQDSGYINANYIQGFSGANEYIATQAPMPATFDDFWRMVWEKEVRIIVMLTVCEEHGKVLCDQYWPSETAAYGPFTVQKVSEVICKEWTIRHLTINRLKDVDSPVRHISQLHYTAWPDRGIPHNPSSLITFAELVREEIQITKGPGPTVLHCSAGVGRTGTFIALDVSLQQLKAGYCIDIFHTVYQMRLSRYLMLQTLEQYIFVHRCILEKSLQKGQATKHNYGSYEDAHSPGLGSSQ
ncbi:hypothetical protein GDO86_003389 [Hymenochirus boettgeri]|nr:hypothetical protein GDO86_003389 [Hymenochirus boettgeri]